MDCRHDLYPTPDRNIRADPPGIRYLQIVPFLKIRTPGEVTQRWKPRSRTRWRWTGCGAPFLPPRSLPTDARRTSIFHKNFRKNYCSRPTRWF